MNIIILKGCIAIMGNWFKKQGRGILMGIWAGC